MHEQRQDDQLEPTYSSSVPIWDVTLKTCRKQLTIERGGERGSGISVLMARCDDDDVSSNYPYKDFQTKIYLQFTIPIKFQYQFFKSQKLVKFIIILNR